MEAEINNRIALSGTLLTCPVLDHSVYGENFYIAYMEVERLSGAVDTLPVTLPERVLNRMPEEGERLSITGQLRSYNRQSETGTRLILTAFAREVIEAESDEKPLNEVNLTGYICKPVVHRTTPFMREIADMLIAVNRPYGKSDYIPAIAWGRNARYAGGIEVGRRVSVMGRLQSREYTKCSADGTSVVRTAYELSCTAIEAL